MNEIRHTSVSTKTLARIAYVTLGIGVLLTLGFMLKAGMGNGWVQWLIAIPFAAWVMVPYAGIGAAVYWLHRLRRSPRSLAVLTATAFLLTTTAVFLLYQSFVVHLDPQSALVFIFLPLWQLVGLLPFFFVAYMLRDKPAPAEPDNDPPDPLS